MRSKLLEWEVCPCRPGPEALALLHVHSTPSSPDGVPAALQARLGWFVVSSKLYSSGVAAGRVSCRAGVWRHSHLRLATGLLGLGRDRDPVAAEALPMVRARATEGD